MIVRREFFARVAGVITAAIAAARGQLDAAEVEWDDFDEAVADAVDMALGMPPLHLNCRCVLLDAEGNPLSEYARASGYWRTNNADRCIEFDMSDVTWSTLGEGMVERIGVYDVDGRLVTHIQPGNVVLADPTSRVTWRA